MMGQFHVLRLYSTDLAHQDFKSLGAAWTLYKDLTDFTTPGHQVTAEKIIHGVRPSTKGANCYKLPIITFGQICKVLLKGIESLQPFI